MSRRIKWGKHEDECYRCTNVIDCVDGQVFGIDGDGRETGEPCTCFCHISEEDAEHSHGDDRYQEQKEDW